MKPPRYLPLAPAIAILRFFLPGSAGAEITFYDELPYFQTSDSPFFERIQAGQGFLEDFEDHELNTPNIVSWDAPRPGALQIGRTHRFATGSDVPVNELTTWSVDEDDGLNGDFIGAGDTWTTLSASNGQVLGRIEFRFEQDDLGRYPIWVGFVITEALNPFDEVEYTTFTLGSDSDSDMDFDPLSWIPPLNSFPGDTRTHRFFGTEVDDGITRLIVNNARQIDHLQYGYAPIPEPSVIGLLTLALARLAFRRRQSV